MPLDNMLMEHFQPALVNAYLATNGWQIAETRADKSTRWTLVSGEPGELILPPDSINPAIATQKADFITALAAVEGRSPQDVLMTLVHIGADHVRVNLQRPETSRGTLALDNAARLSQGLNKLLSATAWAMLEPGPFLLGKKPSQVSKYARTLEIGPIQAESGYSVHVLSPLEDMEPDAFGRRTLITLVTTLGAARMALEAHTLTPELIGSLIEQFVTADFCEALVMILGKPATGKRGRAARLASREVRFNFDWSPALLPPAGTPSEIIFESDLAENLQETAELLREMPPQENFQMEGTVIDLKRSEQTGIGKVTVSNKHPGSLPKLSMELEPDQYDIAIQAHRDEVPILCVGTLVKEKRTYTLINPSLSPATGQLLDGNESAEPSGEMAQ